MTHCRLGAVGSSSTRPSSSSCLAWWARWAPSSSPSPLPSSAASSASCSASSRRSASPTYSLLISTHRATSSSSGSPSSSLWSCRRYDSSDPAVNKYFVSNFLWRPFQEVGYFIILFLVDIYESISVRYHCGGWSEEVNSCFLISYMVYL